MITSTLKPLILITSLLGVSGAGFMPTAQAAITLVNGGFETPAFGPGANAYPGTIPGWKTTDSSFEIWGTGFGGVPSYEGIQFAELNAFIAGTLYQDLVGIGSGTPIGFEMAHRGRAGLDVMNLTITDLGADNVPGGTGTNLDTILFTKNYTDGTSAWGFYDSSGEAPIVALGNTTRYAFKAVSAAGGISVGNFLDGVAFGEGVVVPEPGTMVAGAMLLIPLWASAFRKSRKPRAE